MVEVERNGSGVERFGLSTKRTWIHILCCGVKTWACFFILHFSSSLSCMNEYLAIDSGGYLYEQTMCINCSVAGCFTGEGEMVF